MECAWPNSRGSCRHDRCHERTFPMKLVVVSHKEGWRSATDASHFATRGGFPAQMNALSEIFDGAKVCVPVVAQPSTGSETVLAGHHLQVVSLRSVSGSG